MAGASDQEWAVARVYSDAMLQLAESQGEVDVLLNELLDLAARMEEDKELRAFVSNPTIDVESRKRTLETLFRGKYSDLFVDSLQVLSRRGRLDLIGAVSEAYRLAREEHQGRVRVHVSSAAPLADEAREKLVDIAAKQTGKEPELVETVDASLIGGLVLRVGDQKFDASVAAKLKGLGDALRDRASREVHSGKAYFDETAG
jgi:F-type H+-transporting ATPase subunit delta